MSEPRFPLAGLAEPGRARLVAGDAAVTLAERRPGSLCELTCWPTARDRFSARLVETLEIVGLPHPGEAMVGDRMILLRFAAGRFLAIGREPGLVEGLEGAIGPDLGAVVDLSSARGGIRVGGPRAEYLLQKGLDFDLDMSAFPAMSGAQSTVHHMPVTVLRLEREVFDLFTFRGFAVSLWEWLSDAAVEVGWRAAPPVS